VRFSRKRQDRFTPIFFQGLGENTCLLQPALKSNAFGLKFHAILTLAEKVQIMDRVRDTPDSYYRQPVVKESFIFSLPAYYFK